MHNLQQINLFILKWEPKSRYKNAFFKEQHFSLAAFRNFGSFPRIGDLIKSLRIVIQRKVKKLWKALILNFWTRDRFGLKALTCRFGQTFSKNVHFLKNSFAFTIFKSSSQSLRNCFSSSLLCESFTHWSKVYDTIGFV